jgi:hypothetical protein
LIAMLAACSGMETAKSNAAGNTATDTRNDMSYRGGAL